MNLANTGVSLIDLKQHRQWASDRVVEGYIANFLPLRQVLLNCLLPAKETDIVGQENSKKNQAIESFDLFVGLFNDKNLPLDAPVQDRTLTLFRFS